MMTPKEQLKQLRKASKPDSSFKGALWSELSSEYSKLHPTQGWFYAKMITVPVTVLLWFIITGTGVYAYSSPKVAEGNVFYPVKQGMEKIEEKWHRSPEAIEEFHFKLERRRYAEIEILIDKPMLNQRQIEFISETLEIKKEDLKEHAKNPVVRQRVRELMRNKMQVRRVLDSEGLNEEGTRASQLNQTHETINN